MIILLAVSFGACSGKQAPPEDILTKEQFTHILIETHLIEAKIERLYVSNDSAQTLFSYFQGLLFEQQETDSATFYKTLDYYKNNPKRFLKLYEVVTDSLLEMEAKGKLTLRNNGKKEEPEETKPDSLSKGDSLKNLQIEQVREAPKVKRRFQKDSID